MDFSQSALFFDLSFQLVIYHHRTQNTFLFFICLYAILSRESVFSIETGYELDKPKFGSRQRHKILGFWKTFPPCLGPDKPPIQWVSGALPSRVKWPWREADNLTPLSVEVTNGWSYTSLPPVCPPGVCRESFLTRFWHTNEIVVNRSMNIKCYLFLIYFYRPSAILNIFH